MNKQIFNYAIVIFILIMICGSLILITLSDRDTYLESRTKSVSRFTDAYIENQMTKLRKYYIGRVHGFANTNKQVIQAMKENDRTKLAELAWPRFKVFQKSDPYFDSLTFVNKDLKAMLRMKFFDKYGDDVSHIEIIKAVHESKKPVSGITVTKAGLYYTAASPCFIDDEYIGIVVFVINPGIILDDIENVLNTDYAVFVEKDIYKDAKFSNQPDKKLSKSLLVTANSKIFNSLQDGFALTPGYHKFDINNSNEKLIFHSYQLNDFKDQKIANLLVLSDLKQEISLFDHFINRTLFMSVSAVTAGLLLFYLTFGRLNVILKKQVEDRTIEIQKANKKLEDLNKELAVKVTNETEKRLKNEQILFEQSKMADMGRMLQAIAHQWRQPLNALGLQLQDMEDAWKFNELNEKYLKNSINESLELINHMSTTIDDFRNYYKADIDNISNFNVSKIIENTLSLMRSQFEFYNVECRFDKKQSELIKGDEGKFKQAVLNIVHNALDSIIELKETDANLVGVIQIEVLKIDDAVNIIIRDNGKGFSESAKQKAFQPYFSTKEEGKGQGIGLYMTKLIIEDALNGRITAGNHADGAEIKIIIPASES